MLVTEYRDRFLQLARYAPADVADDRKKQEHFMEGLEDYLQYALLNLRFDDFNHLVDSALNTLRKHLEMEDKKRKIVPVASGSNTRPRLQPPQQYQQQQYRPPQLYQQRPQQYPPRQQQQAGQVRGYRHLRLVLLHQLRQHLRLHVRQLLPDSRLRHLHASAITAASRGTTPTLAPGRRRQDSRGAQLSPGRQHRLE